jgi:predicted lipid-binding transport protein (Tim44 family)
MQDPQRTQEGSMLGLILAVLLVMWLLGTLTGTTIGGVVHVLMIIAVATVLIHVIQSRQPV